MDKNICCPDEVIESMAKKLKVLGHPIRLKILCLIEKNDACVTDLWTCLNIAQPVISQHLAILKEAQIVDSEASGNKRIYKIGDPMVKNLINLMITSRKH
jgi:DNA-binding transcriptional ArsR family regulator